jgi:hypothetical protein
MSAFIKTTIYAASLSLRLRGHRLPASRLQCG